MEFYDENFVCLFCKRHINKNHQTLVELMKNEEAYSVLLERVREIQPENYFKCAIELDGTDFKKIHQKVEIEESERMVSNYEAKALTWELISYFWFKNKQPMIERFERGQSISDFVDTVRRVVITEKAGDGNHQ